VKRFLARMLKKVGNFPRRDKMAELNLVPKYKSIFLINKQIQVNSVSGLSTGINLIDAREVLGTEQLDVVKKIRAKKLGKSTLSSYRQL
jgi:hypothetical protein